MQSGYLSLILALTIFSFLINSVLIVPFIDFLYKLKFTRQKEAPKKGKVPLYDKLHDIKAGTPVGGGILIVLSVAILFWILFPLSTRFGIFVQAAYNLRSEIIIIFLTFISFGILGALDDWIKIFGKGRSGENALGLSFGLSRRTKFIMQCILGLVIGYLIYNNLGIRFIHLPLIETNLNLGAWYIPFAAFVIVSFSNAFNLTDGLDGLATGLLLICLCAFGFIVAGNLDTPLAIFISLWIGALIAFLYFNVYPARLFLGDTGALSFGATLAVIGLMSGSIIALVVIGGIFVIEILTTAMQIVGIRVFKRRVFPMAPIHHAFLARGWQEPKIVMRAWIAGIMLAIFGLWLATI